MRAEINRKRYTKRREIYKENRDIRREREIPAQVGRGVEGGVAGRGECRRRATATAGQSRSGVLHIF